MSTTNLFVELIVIGVGAAVWVVLLILSAVGYDEAFISALAAPVPAVAALSIIYVLGIVTDRLADIVFETLWTDKLRRRWFPTIEDYYETRREMFEKSVPLAELFEYGRSRLRICRGWAFNTSVSVMALIVFLISPSFESLNKPHIFVSGTLGLLLLAVGTGYAWKRIAESEYRRLYEYARTSK